MSKGVPSIKQRREELQKKKHTQQNRMIVIGGGVVILLVTVIVLWSLTISDSAGVTLEGERPLAALEPAARDGYYTEAGYPEMMIDTSKTYEAVITLQKGGAMRLNLFDDESPLAVNSFVFLATQGFFDGVPFHRVLPDFMAQGGDPTGTGLGGPGYQFANETANGLSFDRRGLLAMANAGPDTNGSQFFITFAPTTQLDGGYTIFGELIEGDEVLSSITLRDPEGGSAPADAVPDVIARIDIVEK